MARVQRKAAPPRPQVQPRWLLIERDYVTDTIGLSPSHRRFIDVTRPAGREEAAAYLARHPGARPVLPLRTWPSAEPAARPSEASS